MSRSGSSTTRVPRVEGERPVSNRALGTTEVAQEKPVKAPKVSFQEKLPAWVVAGKPQQAGPLRVIWWLYARLNLFKVNWLPMPPERLFYREEIRQISKSLIRRRPLVSKSVVTIATKKGGAGKTTVASWLIAALGTGTKATVAGFDLEGAGKLAQRFGIDPEKTLTSDLFVRVAAEHDPQRYSPEYADLVRQAQADEESGAIFVHSKARPNGDFSGVATQRGLRYFSGAALMTVVDTPPTFNHHSTRGALGVSQVRVIVGLAEQGETLEDIKTTLENRPYNLTEHLEQVVVVINGVRRRNLNARTRQQFAVRYGVQPEQVILIPYDPYVKNEQHPDEAKAKRRTVKLSAVSPRTQYAWYKLADVVTQRIAAYNAKHPQGSLLIDAAHLPDEQPEALELIEDLQDNNMSFDMLFDTTERN